MIGTEASRADGQQRDGCLDRVDHTLAEEGGARRRVRIDEIDDDDGRAFAESETVIENAFVVGFTRVAHSGPPEIMAIPRDSWRYFVRVMAGCEVAAADGLQFGIFMHAVRQATSRRQR